MIGKTADCNITEVLQTTKTLLMHEDNAWAGNFPSLCTEIHIEATKKRLRDARLNSLNMLTSYISQDIGNIGAIITRLSWMREKACHDDYLHKMWMFFASADISLFHIEIKSIMDYIAEIIAEHANKRVLQKLIKLNKWSNGPQDYSKIQKWLNVPQKFAGLKQWLKKDVRNKRHQSLGSEIAKMVEITSWYDDISIVRNKTVHKGGYSLVFPQPEEGILFQIYSEGYEYLIRNNFYIVKNNIASFKRYAALYLSHLMIFLERFAALSRHKLSFTGDTSNAKLHSFGFDILVKWIDSSLEYINSKD